MEYREFGKASFRVSRIGMGTFFDAGGIVRAMVLGHHKNEEDKISAVKKGIDLGINLIDTAEIYQSESYISEAIKGYKRDSLFIATKVFRWHLKYEALIKAANQSLGRLQTSYIDLYQIHHPNSRVPIKETMSALEHLVSEGKIKCIGVSNFTLGQVKEAQEALSKNELVSVQNQYNLTNRKIEADLLPYCLQNNIAVLAYYPLAHGKLTNISPRTKEALDEISQKHGGKTPAQIALNWFLSKNERVFPIPRASKPSRVIENVGATEWHMDKDEIAKLEDSLL
jgi:diketogulonate reductase-like aldo/keto reductase